MLSSNNHLLRVRSGYHSFKYKRKACPLFWDECYEKQGKHCFPWGLGTSDRKILSALLSYAVFAVQTGW